MEHILNTIYLEPLLYIIKYLQVYYKYIIQVYYRYV